MKRAHLLQLIEAALAARQAPYAAQVARHYLADWPDDLELQYQLARAYLANGEAAAAAPVLASLVDTDPEAFAAQRALAEIYLNTDPAAAVAAFTCAHIGDGAGAPPPLALPGWAAPARAAWLAERAGDLATARRESLKVLAADPQPPLASLVHLNAVWHAGQFDLALPLAEGFAARWPTVVAFKLCLAECLFAAGEAARAMTVLHDAAARDVAGQVAARHWGEAHPYRALWQADLAADLPAPLPAELVQALGLNRLPGRVAARAARPAGSTPASEPPSEEMRAIQAELDRLARRLGRQSAGSAKSSATPPGYYILLSSRTRLTERFGAEGFAEVDAAARSLAAAPAELRGAVLYVDEAATLRPFGLEPVDAASAWDIKLLIRQLAQTLGKRGSALAALLLIGGPEIVPFHHLPNPTEDPDADIPSDNPYATADENYFVPEWPVGRLPSGAGRDPAPLVRALRAAARQHTAKRGEPQRGWLGRLWAQLTRFWRRPAHQALAPSFGYSANVWKHASAAVYRTIGDPRDLQTCPPLDASRLPAEGLAPARHSYFNLHGVEDGPEWYGQRAHDDPPTLPEYPVALRPGDVANSGRAPAIVFSEACYGAHIIGKSANDALCLRFLEAGSRAVIGSTKIAYGSVSEPLIGADLLGQCVWQNIAAGLPVGEALRLAKLQTAQEMHTRQGFLDGEDQKTLIAFVLYGDPLAVSDRQPESAARLAKQRALRFTAPRPRLATPAAVPLEGALSPETVASIKTLVAQYLPEMRDAELRAARLRAVPANAKRAGKRATTVTLSKTIHVSNRAHAHFARVTLDEAGQVVKLSVSR